MKNVEPETQNPKPGTQNPELETQNPEPETQNPKPGTRNPNIRNRRIKLGIFLMVFSGVFFAATLLFPLTDLPVKIKIIASTVSLILMEIVFWSGGLLVGKELFTRYKKKLNPLNWFRNTSPSAEKDINS